MSTFFVSLKKQLNFEPAAVEKEQKNLKYTELQSCLELEALKAQIIFF